MYLGRPLTSRNICPIYSPIEPKQKSSIPPKKQLKIRSITQSCWKLAKNILLQTAIVPKIVATIVIVNPKIDTNLKGTTL